MKTRYLTCYLKCVELGSVDVFCQQTRHYAINSELSFINIQIILNKHNFFPSVFLPVKKKQKNKKNNVKFSPNDTYTIGCVVPRTVLEAIKSSNKYKKMVKGADVNVIIQMGTGDDESIVPTHFPCSCVGDHEVLTISCKSEKVEVAQVQDSNVVYPRDAYSVFYIDTKGGLNAKKKQLFKSGTLKQFKYLCVYGEKGITVAEALKRDGRFTDDLGYFELVNINDKCKTECTDEIDNLDKKKFKICCSIDSKEVYKLLRKQFPRLKKWMESRFPENSFQKTLRKENFGKIQQSFSEIHQVRLLLELSESVCLLEVPINDPFIMQGTGFVLFDNFVLTNAHLFKYWVDSKLPNWHEDVNITAVFNFEKQDSDKNKINAKVFVGNDKLDYAILKLETESQVPPGLLKRFGPVPLDGAACVVGHPGEGVKKTDPTCIIVKEGREEAVNKNLEDIKEYFITLYAINQAIKNDPCENIYVTYNSFMYHGYSGSPVFDAYGQVFGLHTGGFFYGFPKTEQSVIEFSFPLLTIFENFVDNVKKEGNKNLFKRVEEEAKGNPHLENIIASVVGSKQDRPEELLQGVQGNTADSEEGMELI
uniref:Serine protease n=1 Tax=Pundamilia nyererei TaxID=303518 RepID=A0A3B4HCH3_9CICH